jgi:hypothetical protein
MIYLPPEAFVILYCTYYNEMINYMEFLYLEICCIRSEQRARFARCTSNRGCIERARVPILLSYEDHHQNQVHTPMVRGSGTTAAASPTGRVGVGQSLGDASISARKPKAVE